MLEVNDVVTHYGNIQALKGVSLSVREGGITCLLGPNGAGKTTLMFTIAGILKARRGSITFDGMELVGRSPAEIVGSGLVLVPENHRRTGLPPPESVPEFCATHRFCQTVRSSNKRMFWNVRAIPRDRRTCGGRVVMSWPWNTIRPWVAGYSPQIRLTVVLLPEPLGPMRPRTSPSDTAMCSWSAAEVSLFIWAIVITVMAALWWMDRSRAGAVLRAVGADETAAQSVGLSLTAVKVSAMTAGGFIAAIGGGLYAHVTTHVQSDMFNVLLATFAVAYPILGGRSNVFGTLFAVLFIQGFLIEGLRFLGEWRNLLFGLLILLIMNIRPDGILDASALRRILGLFGRGRQVHAPS